MWARITLRMYVVLETHHAVGVWFYVQLGSELLVIIVFSVLLHGSFEVLGSQEGASRFLRRQSPVISSSIEQNGPTCFRSACLLACTTRAKDAGGC